jgi:hypothetical protein
MEHPFVLSVAKIINNDNITQMGTSTSDLLLHPVRLRIVMALAGDELTTAQLGERLPEIPPATLYRQVATLHEGGVLTVVGERRVRGGVERTYGIVEDSTLVGPDDASAMSRDEHMTGFVTFVGALVDSMGRYLENPATSPGEDAMGYRQLPLWLDADELDELIDQVAAILRRYTANEPSPGRSRLTLSTILIPDPPSESRD